MSVERGSVTEANLLVKKENWPLKHAYVGDLVIHSYLSREEKILVQQELWKVAHGIINLLPTRSKLVLEYTHNWPAYWKQKPRLYLVEKESNI